MGRELTVTVAVTIAAVISMAFMFGCGGGGAPVVEPPPENPADVPDQTPPLDTPHLVEPGETPLPQSTAPYPGDGTDWLLAAFNSASAGGGEPDSEDTVPPTAVLISGISSDYTAWGKLDLALFGQDDIGVNLMALAIDGVGVGIVNAGRLDYVWDTFAIEDGDHYLDILARDVGFNCVRCTVKVEVKNSVDNAPPVIDLTSIESWFYEFSGTREITASASDDIAVTRGVISIDGEEVYSTDSGDFRFQLNTIELVDGYYDLEFTAYDAVGNYDQETRELHVDNNTPKCTLTGRVAGLAEGRVIPYWVNVSDYVNPDYPHYIKPERAHNRYNNPGWYGEVNLADGSFVISDVPVGRTQFKIVIGQLEVTVPINLPQGGEYTISESLTRIPAMGNETFDISKVGVVTGTDEGLEHTMAKLGYGNTNGAGALILGTEVFSLIDGDDSLPDGNYPNFDDFISNPGLLDNYESLLISAGNIFEKQFLNNPACVNALRDWVEMGGKLYCGGTSYDFIERTFPDKFDFSGADEMDGQSDVPEPYDAAMTGEKIELAALVKHNREGPGYSPTSWWLNRDGFETIPSSGIPYLGLPMPEGWLEIDKGYGVSSYITFSGETVLHTGLISADYSITDPEVWEPLADRALGCILGTKIRETTIYNASYCSSLTVAPESVEGLSLIERLIEFRLYGQIYGRKDYQY